MLNYYTFILHKFLITTKLTYQLNEANAFSKLIYFVTRGELTSKT